MFWGLALVSYMVLAVALRCRAQEPVVVVRCKARVQAVADCMVRVRAVLVNKAGGLARQALVPEPPPVLWERVRQLASLVLLKFADAVELSGAGGWLLVSVVFRPPKGVIRIVLRLSGRQGCAEKSPLVLRGRALLGLSVPSGPLQQLWPGQFEPDSWLKQVH